MARKKDGAGLEVQQRIHEFRGQRVILDCDLAELYGVSTKRLNEQVRRNLERFPSDFLFRLADQELVRLRSQFATSNEGRGGRRNNPFAFTEHGAVMAANVLNSPLAIKASILVVHAFIQAREMIAEHADLKRRLDDLERRLAVSSARTGTPTNCNISAADESRGCRLEVAICHLKLGRTASSSVRIHRVRRGHGCERVTQSVGDYRQYPRRARLHSGP